MHGRFALVIVEQLGDAEIQQLHLALGGDQDVGGLEVAMHDQVGVGMADHRADLQHQLQAPLQRERQALAVLGDRLAFHIRQRQVRLPLQIHAGIQQMGQVRVLQPRQDLAFAAEALAQAGIGVAAAQQLQRDLALIQAISALGQPDLAHPALAERPKQAVRTDPRAHPAVFRRGGPQRLGQELVAVALMREQALHILGQARIFLTQAQQPLLTRRFGQFQQLIQQAGQLPPA
ncbi:hypothetical protein D3C71_1510120 [compost metagenome]